MKLKPIVWICAGVYGYVCLSYFNMQMISILLVLFWWLSIYSFHVMLLLLLLLLKLCWFIHSFVCILTALYKILWNLLFLFCSPIGFETRNQRKPCFLCSCGASSKWMCVYIISSILPLFLVGTLLYIAGVLISSISIPKLGCVLFLLYLLINIIFSTCFYVQLLVFPLSFELYKYSHSNPLLALFLFPSFIIVDWKL